MVSGLSHEACDILVNTTQSIGCLGMVSYDYLEINYNLSIISFCLVYEKWAFYEYTNLKKQIKLKCMWSTG